MKILKTLLPILTTITLTSYVGLCLASGIKQEYDRQKAAEAAMAASDASVLEEIADISVDADNSTPEVLAAERTDEKAENPEPVQEPEEPEDSVSIVMVGDVLLHMPIENACKDENGIYNFDPLFANLKDEISGADMAIVNQEVIIGGEELGISGYPCFNAPYPIGDALSDTGFDVVLHATNHALDKGKTGLLHTFEFWKTSHPEMTVVGINETPEQKENIDIVEKNGIKIAVLNYTYGTNGIALPSDMPYAVDLLEEEKVRQDLAYAEENADFTIVCPHWGTEYKLTPDKSQERWTEIFREGGADLVMGAHPHVIEPVEFFEDIHLGHSNNHGYGDMLVYYSLGNFVSWTSSEGPGVMKRMVGGMAQVTIKRDSSGEVYIADNSVEALVSHLTREHNGVTVYRLSEYTDQLADQNVIFIQDNNFSRQACIDLCNQVWGSDWK